MCRIKNVHFQPAIFDGAGNRVTMEFYIKVSQQAFVELNADMSTFGQGDPHARAVDEAIDKLLAIPCWTTHDAANVG